MTNENKLPESVDVNTVEDIDALINQTQNANNGEGTDDKVDPNTGAPVVLEFPNKIEAPKPGEEPAGTDNKPEENKALDEAWQKKVQDNPELAKYKTLEEFITASKATPAPVTTETNTEFNFEKEVEDVSKIVLDARDKGFASQKAIEAMGADPEVRKLLSQAGLTGIPTTREEWKSVFDEDRFTYDQLIGQYNNFRNQIESDIRATKRAVELVDKANETAIFGFAKGVEAYVGRMNPNLSDELKTEIKTRMEQFFSTAKDNPKYYFEKHGVPHFLNEESLKNDFILANLDLIPKIQTATPPASGPTPGKESAEQELKRLSQGVSMNTLGANGVSTPQNKTINPFDSGQTGSLSDKELDMAIRTLDKQLITTT